MRAEAGRESFVACRRRIVPTARTSEPVRDPGAMNVRTADDWPDLVREHRFGAFTLGGELRDIAAVYAAGVPTATVLLCGRILEALTAESVRAVGLAPVPNVFDNLVRLQQFGLVPLQTAYWAHALRRTANDARHLLRPLGHEDADACAAFAWRWIEWYFCRFAAGPSLPRGVSCGWREIARDHSRWDAVAALDRGIEAGADAVVELWRAEPGRVLSVSTLAAAVAECLLDAGHCALAEEVLREALRLTPGQPRLTQLQGVALSRQGLPDKALGVLMSLDGRGRDDEEWIGIVAAAHKRRWRADRRREADLRRSHALYRDGWRRSRGVNAYLGVNAAATALWFGLRAESRAIAAECLVTLRSRRQLVAARAPSARLGLWDRLAIAECELLAGHFAAAWEEYTEVLSDAGGAAGVRETALAQMDLHLEAFGIGSDEFHRVEARGVSRAAPVCGVAIGVAGHRFLADPDAAARQAEALLRRLVDEHGGGSCTIISALAEGADRIVASEGLRVLPGARVRAILPLEIDDYVRDFATAASREEFFSLLARAESVEVVASGGSGRPCDRDAAYAACGRRMAEESAVVIAMWDGEPARGPGGTAETVEYARRLGRRVEVIPVRRAGV